MRKSGYSGRKMDKYYLVRRNKNGGLSYASATADLKKGVVKVVRQNKDGALVEIKTGLVLSKPQELNWRSEQRRLHTAHAGKLGDYSSKSTAGHISVLGRADDLYANEYTRGRGTARVAKQERRAKKKWNPKTKKWENR